MPGFETFTRRLVPLAREPRLTIQKRGTISLNRSAYAVLGSPEAVELLFDRDRSIVGLRSVVPTCAHAYPVRSATGNGAGPFVVSALAFVKYFGIGIETSMRWDAYLDGDVLCADLGSPGTRVTSNRASTRGDGPV
ncbi:MAG: hypothetical protein M3130_03155 [Actinomycetota bacterium]|nr:hypothetical protein [Actinomycetota bacterium]